MDYCFRVNYLCPFIITSCVSLFLLWFISRLDSKKFSLKHLNILESAIVFLGIVLRLIRYFVHPMDMACYRRVMTMKWLSFGDLLHLGPDIPSRINDPFGILAVQKIMISLFGYSEYSVRLFVLLCSLASIFLFKRIKNWFCSREAGLVALLLFCLSRNLLIYSAEINKYSADIMFTLLLFLMAKRMRQSPLNFLNILLYGLLGALGLWFSYAAVFILGGIWVAMVAEGMRLKDIKFIGRSILMGFLWFFSFILYYFHYAYFIKAYEHAVKWEPCLMPLKVNFLSFIGWFAGRIYYIFADPICLCLLPFVGIIMFFLGSIYMFRTKRYQAVMLLGPLVLVILAAMLRKYALGYEAVTFLIPGFYLLVATGWKFFLIKERSQSKPVLTVMILFFLLFRPVQAVIFFVDQDIHHKTGMNSMNDLLENVKNNFKAGDIIYVHSQYQYRFLYTNIRFGFTKDQYKISRLSLEDDCSKDLQELKQYKRIWFIYSELPVNKMKQCLDQLGQIGSLQETDQFGWNRSELYVLPD